MTVFASHHHLRYRATAYRFDPTAALRLDESYRLCHLPLIAADHPDVIAARAGIEMGRLPAASFALVIPIDAAALDASPAYRQMIAAFRHAPFAAKIDWGLIDRRRDRLHATLRSHLHANHNDDGIRHLIARLRRQPLFAARLLGPWMGDKNHGRFYLPLLPQARRGVDPCRRLQRATRSAATGIYVVGLLHLRDHLSADETAALRALLRDWRDRVILDFTVRELWLLAAHDSLALDSRIVERIALRRSL